MTNRFRLIIGKFSLNPRRLFLLDSLGALLTAFLNGVILTKFQDLFGMPPKVLTILSAIAFTYATYSICCYFFIGQNWRPYMKAIAFANLAYCCLTIGFVFAYYPSTTILGLSYFLAELIVIICLLVIELKTASYNAAGN